MLWGEGRSLALPLLCGRRENIGKVSDAFMMLEKCGLLQLHIQNVTLPRVEYEIEEALKTTAKYKNEEQRRKSRLLVLPDAYGGI
jgi:hypothetical protein